MDSKTGRDDEQAALWNGDAGRAWVDAQALLDEILRPFEDLLVDAATSAGPSRVLDVGCGTGATTLAVARRLGGAARVVGIDLSEPAVTAAKARADREGAPVEFIRADAQTYAFAPASFEMIVSRFGVMFFDDAVKAFANLRRASTGSALLRCLAWRLPEENPFMTTAERAAAEVLPDLPARRPGAPGQFAFGERDHVYRILDESGWTAIDVRPIDVTCRFPERELLGYVTRMGPLGRRLQEEDERVRARVVDAVRPAFDPYVHGAEVRFTAACWMVGARNRMTSLTSGDVPPPTASGTGGVDAGL